MALLVALLAGCAAGQAGTPVAASPKSKPTAVATTRAPSVKPSPAKKLHSTKKPRSRCAKGSVTARLKCLNPAIKSVQVLGKGENLDVTIFVNSAASQALFGVEATVHGENQDVVRAAARVFGQSSVEGLSVIGVGPLEDKYGNTSTQPLWVWGTYHGHFSHFNLGVLEMKTLWDAGDKSGFMPGLA
ncbi:hypothetical protein [Streptomyces sp. NPDC046759]|uniref:hypothetical protein n=1 Tax=Streptomyces sp. NPDC046759 TaxID=3155019 RepID=UPI00340C07D7